jgi:hypothetical protein
MVELPRGHGKQAWCHDFLSATTRFIYVNSTDAATITAQKLTVSTNRALSKQKIGIHGQIEQ